MSSTDKKINVWARHKGRKLLVQSLYQWHCNKCEIAEITAQCQTTHKKAKVDWLFFSQGFKYITQNIDKLDQQIAPLLDRPVEEVDIIEQAILRMGAWELTTDTPVKVVINEAVEVAKEFAGTDSYKYINSILDALAKEIAGAYVEDIG